ncbi:MAG TPA: GIY-YIG nuclease family protein [Bacteroidia bacterium]
MKVYFVYILLCSNEGFYTGLTSQLSKRLQLHRDGLISDFTKKNLPISLVYFEMHTDFKSALLREKQIRGWSRAKKKALSQGEFKLLHRLAECQNHTHYKYKP